MLESYVRARKMFLKPGGKMFPSVGSIYCCPFTDEALYQEQVGKVGFWNSTNFYGLDLTCLAPMGKSDHFSQPVVGYGAATTAAAAAACARCCHHRHQSS